MGVWKTICRVLMTLIGLCNFFVVPGIVILDLVENDKQLLTRSLDYVGRISTIIIAIYFSMCLGIIPKTSLRRLRCLPAPWKLWRVLYCRTQSTSLLEDSGEETQSGENSVDPFADLRGQQHQSSDELYAARRAQRRPRLLSEACDREDGKHLNADAENQTEEPAESGRHLSVTSPSKKSMPNLPLKSTTDLCKESTADHTKEMVRPLSWSEDKQGKMTHQPLIATASKSEPNLEQTAGQRNSPETESSEILSYDEHVISRMSP